MDLVTLPVTLDRNTSEPCQSHSDQSPHAIISSEDSYFADTPARPESLGLRDLGLILNNRRRATLHVAIRGVGTAWIDQDDSGTYDPTKDHATPSPRTPPRRRRRARTCYENDESVVPQSRPRESRPPVGYRSIIVFSFTTEKALEYLRGISPGPFPRQCSTPEENFSDSSSEPDKECDFGPPLRRRTTGHSMKSRYSSTREDGLTIDQLTIGNPQRRGCKACFEVGDDECTLIDHGKDYPCTACDDASIDCEYIIPPELKKSCERCKRKRISCSYHLDGGQGVDSCDACAEVETKCQAGPLKGSLPEPHDPPPTGSGTAALPRKYVACNQCRNNSLRCTLKRTQPGPCSNCRKQGEECHFILIPPFDSLLDLYESPPSVQSKRGRKAARKRRKKPVRQRDPDVDHTPDEHGGRLENTLLAEAWYQGHGKRRPLTLLHERERYAAHTAKKQAKLEAKARRRSASLNPAKPSNDYKFESKPPLGSTGGIKHVRIVTAFSHPISFNYITDPRGTSPCSWCSTPFFGQYGHGDVEVEVIAFPQADGSGYEEISGGHAEGGQERSKMCVQCTFERVSIMGCEKHEMRAIDVDARLSSIVELEKAAMGLVRGDEAAGRFVREAKWCAVCPDYASFKCSARQAEDDLPADGLAEGCGCGLYVCEKCEDLMSKISNHGFWTTLEVLDRTIRLASGDKFNYEYGVRADASFLTSAGELIVRIHKGMGENADPANGDDGRGSSDGEGKGDSGDEEIWTTLERVGKGKGKWNENQKPAPEHHDIRQRAVSSTMQQRKRTERGGMTRSAAIPFISIGSMRQSSFGGSEQGRQLTERGFRPSREERKGQKVGIGRYVPRLGRKGKRKGKAAISEVVVIDDSEND